MSERAAKTKVVWLRDWPLCASCYRRHRLLRVVAAVLLWGGLAALVAAIVIRIVSGELQPMLLAPMLGGIGAAIGSAFVFAASGLARLTGARVSADGATVSCTDPHPDFAGELTRMLS